LVLASPEKDVGGRDTPGTKCPGAAMTTERLCVNPTGITKQALHRKHAAARFPERPLYRLNQKVRVTPI
jgi:hypothetical protein